VGVLFGVVGLLWVGGFFVTYLVGCWSRLAPPSGEELTLRLAYSEPCRRC